MATSREEIGDWFDEGVQRGATHMIVVCDTLDHSDYPVYVQKGEDVRQEYSKYDGPNMQRVMEVYSLSRPRDAQLTEGRAFHFD